MTIRQELIQHLSARRVELNRDDPFRKLDVEEYFDTAVSHLYLLTRDRPKDELPCFAEVICGIGHRIRGSLNLDQNTKKAAALGSFFVYTFEALEIIETFKTKGANGHSTYVVKVLKDHVLQSLWIENADAKNKYPLFTQPAPWVSGVHKLGLQMVKTGCKEVIASLHPDKQPLLFHALNKQQSISWKVNRDILELAKWCIKKKQPAFNNIWNSLLPQSRESKLREATTTLRIAEAMSGRSFFHLYTFDFRGRIYTNSNFLNEQSTDLAKGLLQRAVKKPMTKLGFQWLLICLANSWAGDCGREDGRKSDKISLADRQEWALDNELTFLDYAENPKEHTGWMNADQPWQFLTACMEFMNLRLWQLKKGFDDFDCPSGFVGYIDGTVNGSQHIAALTRDEVVAKFVNLIPQEFPGDLYTYVAEKVWNRMQDELERISQEDLENCEWSLDKLSELKKEINKLAKDDLNRKQTISELQALRKVLPSEAAPLFWSRFKSLKDRRKIVKRNVMTIP